MKNESYSVLMSVYQKDNAKFFEEAIKSILTQTYITNDFVIVCDGPLTKELNIVIEKYEKKYSFINVIRLKENIGLGLALNKALPQCRNRLVARMDSDDISLPKRMIQQVEAFRKNEDLAVVSGTIIEYDLNYTKAQSAKTLPETHEEIYKYAKKRNPFNHPAVMFDKSVILSVGGYQDFYLYEDYHLWIRLLHANYQGYNIETPLLHMRAGIEMTNRRGGYKYFKSTKRFQKFLRKLKFISYTTYLFNIVTRFTVQVLVPNKLRHWIYRKLLR